MSGLQTAGCDYTCQRRQNIDKLKTLYTTELQNYNGAYNEWLTLKADENADDADILAAQTSVEEINQTLNSILFELKKNIEYTDGLIANQKRVIQNKNAEVVRQNRAAALQDSVTARNNELISKPIKLNFQKKECFRKFILLILVILKIFSGLFTEIFLKK